MRKIGNLRAQTLVKLRDVNVGVAPAGDRHTGPGPAQQRSHVAVAAPDGKGQHNTTQRRDGELDHDRAPRVHQLAGNDRSQPDPQLTQAVREPQRGVMQHASAMPSGGVKHRDPVGILHHQIRKQPEDVPVGVITDPRPLTAQRHRHKVRQCGRSHENLQGEVTTAHPW